jgi:dienelactone hydrolase
MVVISKGVDVKTHCGRTIRRISFLSWLIPLLFLASCKPAAQALEATGIASPEAVALSLSTVDPEDSLHLFDYDRDAPLDIQEDNRWHEGNATWIDFTYASPRGGPVKARLVIPDGRGPFPGIILQHGGTGRLEEMAGHADAFARYGAVAIMITDPYRRPGGWEVTPYMGNTWPLFTARDLDIKIQLIVDQRRAIDILSARPEVDPERLAYFGISFGGAMGGLLAGVEDRLVAYVLQVGDGGLVEHTSNPGEDGLNIHFNEKWAALMWPTESLHFIGRAAPAALLFQNALYDGHSLPHDAIRYQTAASEPKTVMWYDSGHGLPWQSVIDAAKWLQPYLGDKLFLVAPNYRPSAVILDRALIVVMLLSLSCYGLDSIRRRYLDWGSRILWLITVILLGPIGLALYACAVRLRSGPAGTLASVPIWKRMLGVAVMSTMPLIVGLLLSGRINDYMQDTDFRLRLLQLYLTTMIVGWLLSLLARRIYRSSAFAFILTANLIWVTAMLVPSLLAVFFEYRNLPVYPTTALIGITLAAPLQLWLLNKKFVRWNLLQGVEAAAPSLKRPPLFLTLVLLFLSFTSALASVVIMLQLGTGFSYRTILLFLRGTYL